MSFSTKTFVLINKNSILDNLTNFLETSLNLNESDKNYIQNIGTT